MSRDKLKTLSFSAYKRYTTCAKLDYMHTVEGIRPKYEHSALLFGNACDAMLNSLLDAKLGHHSNPAAAFEATITSHGINNILWDRKEDLDMDLIKPGQYDAILLDFQSRGYTGDDLKKLANDIFDKVEANDNIIEAYEALSDNQRHVLSTLCTTVMINKSEYILAAYKRYILPRILKVEQVQIEWNIPDELGNPRIMGIADYVCEFKNEGRVLFDNKTCKKPYKEHAAKRDPQLLTYATALGLNKVGFIAILKHMKKNKVYACDKCEASNYTYHAKNKKCKKDTCEGTVIVSMKPEAMIQVLIETVPEHYKEMAREALIETQKLREQGPWPRNLNACNWIYGKPCVYIEKCWGNSNKNLTKKDK